MDTVYVPSIGPDPDLNGCGFVGGVLGGWNYQISDFVIGVEGDIMWGGDNATNHLDAVEYEIDMLSTVRGRLGWLSHSNTLIYGTGGVGWLKGTMDALVGPFSLPGSDTRTHFGFVVGGGIEHAFTENLHGRIEYLYGSFNDKDYDLSVTTCGTPCIADLDFEHLHVVRASLTWNFGGLFY
jgi:outer membrane immunogenic protein